MKIKNITEKFSRGFNKTGLVIKKHSPEILIVAGVVGTVTSTVLACKATLKVNEVLAEGKENSDKIHYAVEHQDELKAEYTEADAQKDLTTNMVQTSVKVAKLYAPAVILGGLSLGMIFASNNILRKRNASLAAAYVTLDTTFKKYRQNVVDRFGTDVDHELRYSLKKEQVVEEDGTVTEQVTADIEPTDTAKWFDSNSPYWEGDSEYALWFLKGQQAIANDKLKVKGYLFLNDVYDMLGIEKTKAGQTLGWIYNTNDPDFNNFVDFGIYDYINGNKFVNCTSDAILLDFNVDGNILDLMK